MDICVIWKLWRGRERVMKTLPGHNSITSSSIPYSFGLVVVILYTKKEFDRGIDDKYYCEF
jgi:hypothetical protein